MPDSLTIFTHLALNVIPLQSSLLSDSPVSNIKKKKYEKSIVYFGTFVDSISGEQLCAEVCTD
jgi:hypothetical protein